MELKILSAEEAETLIQAMQEPHGPCIHWRYYRVAFALFPDVLWDFEGNLPIVKPTIWMVDSRLFIYVQMKNDDLSFVMSITKGVVVIVMNDKWQKTLQ